MPKVITSEDEAKRIIQDELSKFFQENWRTIALIIASFGGGAGLTYLLNKVRERSD